MCGGRAGGVPRVMIAAAGEVVRGVGQEEEASWPFEGPGLTHTQEARKGSGCLPLCARRRRRSRQGGRE